MTLKKTVEEFVLMTKELRSGLLSDASHPLYAEGCIQRFEVTFELAWKSLQKLFAIRGKSIGSPKTALVSAREEGIIQDVDAWLDMLHYHNLTVHTYNQQLMRQIIEKLPAMAAALEQLSTTLKSVEEMKDE